MTTQRPSVLVIGGSDSLGLAGIQADNRALNAVGVHAANIISAVTAQNNECVVSVNPVSLENFSDQWQAVDALSINIIKIGLLPTAEQIEFILDNKRPDQRIVWDPVVRATSLGTLAEENDALVKMHRELLKHCALVTPNIDEALALISSTPPNNAASTHDSLANTLLRLGSESALITGGQQTELDRSSNEAECKDYFATQHWFHNDIKQQGFWLSSPCVNTSNTRGTGCTLASTIAGSLALGYAVEDAVVIGKAAINQGLQNSFALASQNRTGKNNTLQKGSLSLRGMPQSEHTLPGVSFESDTPAAINQQGFAAPTLPDGKPYPLGLYPVVDRAEWLARLLPLGVKTIQLRIKDLAGDALKDEIAKGIALARAHNARLFINDHWQLAIELGAYGVHLGQQDLDALLINHTARTEQVATPIEQIKQAGLRLGISTHAFYEVARALPLHPSYIACGPIFATTSKDMPWVPQGAKQLRYWKTLISSLPLVAIGGINRERLGSMIETGVDGIAMITAITEADDPEATTQDFLQHIEQARVE